MKISGSSDSFCIFPSALEHRFQCFDFGLSNMKDSSFFKKCLGAIKEIFSVINFPFSRKKSILFIKILLILYLIVTLYFLMIIEESLTKLNYQIMIATKKIFYLHLRIFVNNKIIRIRFSIKINGKV